MLASSYCSRKASTSNHQSVYVTSAPGSVDLKIGISNLAGTSHFFSLLPLWSLCLHRWPVVSLTVEYPSESSAPLFGEEGGEPPPPTAVDWNLGGLLHGCKAPVWEVSPSLGHLFHPRGSPGLLWYTSHQLAQGVGLPCIHDWNIMDWVLSPSPQPSVVKGSNRLLPCLHQREEANGEVGRARDRL